MARDRFLDRWLSSIVAVVGTVAVVLAFLAVFGQEPVTDGADDIVAAPTEPAPTTPAVSTGDASRSPRPTVTRGPSPSPSPSPSPTAERAPVVVLNQVGVRGLAGRTAQRLEARGWEVIGTGDFSGTVPSNTVYYPPDLEDAAVALTEEFPQITSRTRDYFSGLREDALTLILAEDYER